MRRLAILACLMCMVCGGAAGAQTVSQCRFEKSEGAFAGGCGKIGDETPTMQLHPVAKITTGRWRDSDAPTVAFAGTFGDSDAPNQPLELEIHGGGTGVLRTPYGWFAVRSFTARDGLSFQIDASGEVPPGPLDIAIVKHAKAILASDAVWNRVDNRKCPADAVRWSIYCAMEKATVEITGAFHHRRPALEALRTVVDERTANRNYAHRLMDYNNDPTTTLADVQSLFDAVLDGMNDPVWLKAHGFAAP